MLVAALIVSTSVLFLGLIAGLAAVVYSRLRPAARSSESPVDDEEIVPGDLDVLILDEKMQLKNSGKVPVRLEGSGLKESVLLFPTDLWVLEFDPRHSCVFQLYFLVQQETYEQRFVEIKITAAEVTVRPIWLSRQLEFSIWKLKPVTYKQQRRVVEYMILSGHLVKTVNFTRAHGRYYKIRVNSRRSPTSGLISGSNVDCDNSSGNVPLVSVRSETDKLAAMNTSDRVITVAVLNAPTNSMLSRRVINRMQDLPPAGVLTFMIKPDKDTGLKDLLRLRVTEQTVSIEPPSRFGSLTLHCDIYLLGKESSDSKLIVSTLLLTELELPRRGHVYVFVFSAVQESEKSDGGRKELEEGLCEAAEADATSLTLD